MKALYTWLILAGAGILPACTIHYHGVAPDDHDDHTHSTRVVRTHHTDTVYVTQPGPAGGYSGTVRQSPPPVRGGYTGNGPGRQAGQPVRGGSGQPGGVRTTPGSYPPPRTTGGVRTPGTGTAAGGTNGGVRTPGTGTSAGGNPNGGVRTPQPGTAAGGQAPQQYPTGGIKPVRTAEQPTAGSPAQEEPFQTGGIKPMRTKEQPANNTITHNEDFQTGGIKPMRTKEQPATNTITHNEDFQTGGIKPMRQTEQPATNTISHNEDFQTGGIKPMRTKEQPATNTISHNEDFQTGGIKPMRDHQTPHPGEVPATDGTGHGAAPALMFAKMPCRGTCPTYTATIWPDGRVVYVGQQNVPRLGTHELRLEPATVASLQQQANGLGFAELPESFASGNTDIPATMLTLYWGEGKSKTVSVEDTAPAEVQALFDQINGTLMQLATTTEPSGDPLKPRRGRQRE